MKNKIYKHTPEIILVIYILLFFGFKSPDKPWDRAIINDGKGYYAYLPAIFIYHDLQFNFIEQNEFVYYTPGGQPHTDFRNQDGTRKLDKFFPGMAILWMPFFLFGHLLAWLEKMPMDGYSMPYQYCIALSALLFLWMGARWLQKLLKQFGSDNRTAAFITVAIIFGTNLLFYAVSRPSMTHVYSFALITAMLSTSYKMFHDYQPKWFVRTLLGIILIILIRPSNGLVLLLLPFTAGSMGRLSATFGQVFSEKRTLLRGGIQAIILLSVPFILWQLQTGKPLVYSYGDEKLNFLHPHFLSMIFSFNRGWFVYTPLALFSMFGFIGLYRQYRFRFYWLLGFLMVFIYVSSCWWRWSYDSECGQRVFVDLYAVSAILLLFLYSQVKAVIWKRMLSVVVVLLVSLNILQFYQATQGVLPPVTITGEIYRDSFFNMSRTARVYTPAESIVAKKTLQNDMESEKERIWMNQNTRDNSQFHTGQWSSEADIKTPYSAGLEMPLDSLFSTRNRVVLITAWVKGQDDVTKPSLIVDFQSAGKSLSYNHFELEKFVPTGRWTRIEVAYYVPQNLPEHGAAKIYFYNPSPYYKLYIDDLQIDFLSLKDEPDYLKMEGVNAAAPVR